MKTNRGTVALANRFLLLPAAAFLATLNPASAQQTASAVSAADLARYDTNRNGVLDANEVAARDADQARAAGAATVNAARAEEAVQLSPFEVKEENKGYYASNTMSGTRLNTKIEDLASSISVITKQQMQDFAMLDINDVFNYESSTEGTGNFTAFEVDRNGMVTDQIQNNPQGANRMRGIGSANISLGNFATSGRVPLDPIAIDAIEISRGPNSNIFGLGEGSGTVNMVPSTANFSRESTAGEVRFDDAGGWRTSVDINRPIIRGKLGFRTSAVYQHEEWRQKPSGFESRRFNAMLRYQPFKHTSLRAALNSYHGVGTRPTAVTPRDAVTYWKSLGSPTWDPIANAVTVNGVTTVMTGATNPTGLSGQNFGNPILFIDNGLKLWQIGRLPADTATNGPNNTAGIPRLLESVAEPVRTGRPLFSTLAGISSKSVYDYSSINLAAPNSIKDQVETYTVELEQYLLNTDRHKLAFQLAWQREDADRTNRNVIGQASSTGASYYLYIDPNSKLLDGRPNPFFLRPYVGVGEPITEEQPYLRDSYRGQGAYIVDLTNSDRWTRWLGKHQLLGYYEERRSETYRYRFKNAMISDNPVYAPAGQPKANQAQTGPFAVGPGAARGYYHYYVGDNQGANVDYGPSTYNLGSYPFSWFNAANGGANTYPANTWITEQATLGTAGITEGTAANFSTLNLIKTRGAMLQSYLLQDRIVATFGRRSDESRNKPQAAAWLKPNGWEFDYAAMNNWIGDWQLREGTTKTQGYVVKPFRNWGAIERARAAGGAKGFAGELLNGLTIYYNKSDSFRPEAPAISVRLQDLPNPSSQGKDYGFTVNLRDKFVLRANKYETTQIRSRAGQSAIFGQRVLRVDIAQFAGNNDAISLQRQARNWITQLNPNFSAAQVEAEIARVMQLTPQQLEAYRTQTIGETSDVVSRGNEFELSYNPNAYWTLRANATRSEALDKNLSPNIPAWIAERMPVWTSIIDPRVGTPWIDTGYNGDNPQVGSGTPRTFLVNNVINPLAIATATEGKAKPQTREWRFNLNTSYRLAGMFDHKHLKRTTVGGAVRWESKGAIGYYGVPVNGVIEAATQLDPNRPIYDKARAYFDVFGSYTTRLFNDKVRARFQLNVRNVHESHARLQPVGAYPNGQPHTFRIVDPRLFIFTTSFDL
jgi:outer membrane receptor for ferric coprogen and ferric-rhodotorulic acid